MLRRKLLAGAGLLLAVALTVLSLSHGLEGPRRAVYTMARAVERQRASRTLPASVLESGAIMLYYDDADAALAPYVLAELERLREPVAELLGQPAPEQVTAVLHPSRADLAAVFGWHDGERAHGVYAAGIVRLLSPRVWLDLDNAALDLDEEDGEPMFLDAFRAYGPVAHELAHLVFDLHTAGNYPAWLSEGLAQWVEFRLDSRRQPDGEVGWHHLDRPYTFAQLGRDFDALPNQMQAYMQSYFAVAYLEEIGGADAVRDLVAALAYGQSLEVALQARFGLTLLDLQERLLSGEKPSPGGSGSGST